MKTFQCRDCREYYPMNERFTIQEIPGKGFCEMCFEEILEGWRAQEEDSRWYGSGLGAPDLFCIH